MTDLPSRVLNLDGARARFGPAADALLCQLWRTDPLADAAIPALHRDGWASLEAALDGSDGVSDPVRALLAGVSTVPAWVEPARMRSGGRAFFRTGMIGGMVLGARSLVAGYLSPAGNKPLVQTGALARDGARRLAETGRFVAEVHREGGLLPGAQGWRIALRVRLMHAQVRALLLRSGRWDAPAWGAPLNQHDLLATSLLFSVVWADGVRAMGVWLTDAEIEDHLHLWRWCSVVLGVEPSILPTSAAHGRDLAALIFATQGPPDDDARALVRALLNPANPKGPAGLGEGLCRALLDPGTADALGLGRTPWRHVPRVTRALFAPWELTRGLRPGAEDRAVARGERYWEQAIADGLGPQPARFEPPRALDPAPRR